MICLRLTAVRQSTSAKVSSLEEAQKQETLTHEKAKIMNKIVPDLISCGSTLFLKTNLRQTFGEGSELPMQ